MIEGNPGNLTTGAQFGKYRIVRKLGAGAFGSVFEGLLDGPMGFSKRVAIKKLHSKLVEEDPKFVQSMVNEARIGGLLHHANIVDVIEFGHVGRHYYLAMEYVDGATLDEIVHICRRRQVLLPRFAMIDLAIQVCRGLHHAHNLKDRQGTPLNVIHRDLKPSNIIVDREGTAKICDFGIAKAASNLYQTTSTGLIKGTPRYMSPEQITGEMELGPASDVFSLGAVLYEMITGRLLFQASSFESLIHRILTTDIGDELSAAEAALPGSGRVLERAMHSDPSDRYADARSMANDLRDLGHDYPPEADMAEVIDRLLPELDRTDARDIEDSQDLDLESSLSEDTDASHELYGGSGSTPIPTADPQSTGWQRFSSVLTGSAERKASLSSTTPIVGLKDVEYRPVDLSEDSIESPVPRGGGRRTGWIIALAIAGLTIAIVGIAAVARWTRQDVPAAAVAEDPIETGGAPGTTANEAPADPFQRQTAGDAASDVIDAGQATLPDTAVEPTASGAELDPTGASSVEMDAPSVPELDHPAPAEPPPPEPPPTEPDDAQDAVSTADEASSPAPSHEPGSVSLYTRPWAEIYVDGAHVGSTNTLKGHALEGGLHEVRLVCSLAEGREKIFEFTVDGEAVNLGCWDFTTMAPCTR